jgi:hypothetical protein
MCNSIIIQNTWRPFKPTSKSHQWDAFQRLRITRLKYGIKIGIRELCCEGGIRVLAWRRRVRIGSNRTGTRTGKIPNISSDLMLPQLGSSVVNASASHTATGWRKHTQFYNFFNSLGISGLLIAFILDVRFEAFTANKPFRTRRY